jgi:hypothetical protein
MATSKKASGPSLRFIVSDEKSPKIALKPGLRLDVVSTTLVGPDLKRLRNIGARLCGGSGTCMALVDVGIDAVVNPVAPAKAKAAARRPRTRGTR